MKITEAQLRTAIRKIIKEQASFGMSSTDDPCDRCGVPLSAEDIASGECSSCGYFEQEEQEGLSDNDCPVKEEFMTSLYGDPMTHAMGAPSDEIAEAWMSKHRRTCQQCQEEWMESRMP